MHRRWPSSVKMRGSPLALWLEAGQCPRHATATARQAAQRLVRSRAVVCRPGLAVDGGLWRRSGAEMTRTKQVRCGLVVEMCTAVERPQRSPRRGERTPAWRREMRQGGQHVSSGGGGWLMGGGADAVPVQHKPTAATSVGNHVLALQVSIIRLPPAAAPRTGRSDGGVS